MRREVGHLTSEGEFIHRLDSELISNMHRCFELEQERIRTAKAVRISNPDVLQTLQTLGFTPATVTLIYLMPLVQTAWADGSVSRAERRLILAMANLHGVVDGMPAHDQLEAWFKVRPPEEFVRGSWCAIRKILDSLSPDERAEKQVGLLEECRAVAAVSGGVVHKICAAEKMLLHKMEQDLMPERPCGAQAEETGRQTSQPEQTDRR